jgi:hypothetical protein
VPPVRQDGLKTYIIPFSVYLVGENNLPLYPIVDAEVNIVNPDKHEYGYNIALRNRADAVCLGAIDIIINLWFNSFTGAEGKK